MVLLLRKGNWRSFSLACGCGGAPVDVHPLKIPLHQNPGHVCHNYPNLLGQSPLMGFVWTFLKCNFAR